MSEQVIGLVMTMLFILLILAFVGFFCGFGLGGAQFWSSEAHSLGWSNSGFYTNVFSFGREAIYMFLNLSRESVMQII